MTGQQLCEAARATNKGSIFSLSLHQNPLSSTHGQRCWKHACSMLSSHPKSTSTRCLRVLVREKDVYFSFSWVPLWLVNMIFLPSPYLLVRVCTGTPCALCQVCHIMWHRRQDFASVWHEAYMPWGGMHRECHGPPLQARISLSLSLRHGPPCITG
jgi:hypothetical protein